MTKPEISLANREAVYQFYKDYDGSERALRLLHVACQRLFHPFISFEAGAAERLRELNQTDTRFVMVMNHQIFVDQFHFGHAMATQDCLKPLMGQTFVWGKVPHFLGPKAKRGFFDMMGVVPVWREKDIAEPLTVADQGLGKAEQDEATELLFDVTVAKLTRSEKPKYLFNFPESTRHGELTDSIGHVFGGVGQVAYRAALEVPLAVLPMGVHYGPDPEHRDSRHPDLMIGLPIEGSWSSEDAVTDLVREGLSRCLVGAKAAREAALAQFDLSQPARVAERGW